MASYNMYMGYLSHFCFEGHFGDIRCPSVKLASNVKTAGRRVKRIELWHSGMLVKCIWDTFDLVVFVILGCCRLKMALRRSKRIDIWDSWVVVISIWGTCKTFSVQGHLGSISALVSNFHFPQLALKQSWLKLGLCNTSKT